ncbi:IS200/IS605 family transposase [Phytohalomonas tamaricis]|uniref:IS200/IS605 family transposase n=1 Tax=Phytohalomonas tamaricis TaxID=2081032 RepID=UPI000D0B2B68|nr:IS200/IS605 family transposase [Phytohalomonas tamaricis]
MDKINSLRTGRHCVFEMHVHLVFVTKYRGKVFNDAHLTSLETLFNRVCQDFEAELKEFNGETDHVHLLVNFPPKVAVSKLVNSLKGVSSRRMKLLHPELVQPAYMKNALWSPSYFAGSVGGAPLSVVKQYIEQQTRPE